MKSNTPDLMKFKRLQRQLGESTRGVIGLLEMIWLATAKNCPRGDIGRFADDEIAIMCDWPGDPALLVTAMVETGWLDRHEEHRLVVHDWQEHAPKWVKGVVARRNLGWATLGSQPKVTNPKVPTQGVLPSNTKPSQAKIEVGVPTSCSEANPRFASKPPAVQQEFQLEQDEPPPPDILTFPVRAEEGKPKTWALRAAHLQELQETFPTMDVLGECRKSLTYLKANNKFKTSRGMPKFLFGWLERSNNRLPGGNGSNRESLAERNTRVAAEIIAKYEKDQPEETSNANNAI